MHSKRLIDNRKHPREPYQHHLVTPTLASANQALNKILENPIASFNPLVVTEERLQADPQVSKEKVSPSNLHKFKGIIDNKILVCATPQPKKPPNISPTKAVPKTAGGLIRRSSVKSSSPATLPARTCGSAVSEFFPADQKRTALATAHKSRSQVFAIPASNPPKRQSFQIQEYADRLRKFVNPNISKFMKRSLNYLRRCSMEDSQRSMLVASPQRECYTAQTTRSQLASSQPMYDIQSSQPSDFMITAQVPPPVLHRVPFQIKGTPPVSYLIPVLHHVQLSLTQSLRSDIPAFNAKHFDQKIVTETGVHKFTRLRNYYHSKYEKPRTCDPSSSPRPKRHAVSMTKPNYELSPW